MSCYSKPELENLLEDVVNTLDLSSEIVEHHGQLGTPPAELVSMVLKQKDLEIAALKSGMVDIQK